MTSQQIANAINALIVARDEQGADVQPVIDSLMDQWEAMIACKPMQPTAVELAHAAAVERMM